MIEIDTATRDTIAIFKRYSKLDIATSLFASNLWLPNISSIVKHYFWTSIFLSMKDSDFTVNSNTTQYLSAKSLLQALYKSAPSLPSIEDYIPETEWGDVKFKIFEDVYSIFYGSELENAYDMIESFQALFGAADDLFFQQLNRSPEIELSNCLRLHDIIISSIDNQCNPETIDILPGHIEVPPKNFWESCSTFLSSFNVTTIFSSAFLAEYSTTNGVNRLNYSSNTSFINAYYEGQLVNSLFINIDNTYIPLVPRSSLTIFLNGWSTLYTNNMDAVVKSTKYVVAVKSYIYNFLNERTPLKVYPFTSAVYSDNRPHSEIYAAVIPDLPNKRMILFYLLEPNDDPKLHERYINDVASKLKESVEMIREAPMKMALHGLGKNIQFNIPDDDYVLTYHTFVILPTLGLSSGGIIVPKMPSTSVIPLAHFFGLFDEIEFWDQLWDFLEYIDSNERLMFTGYSSILDQWGSCKSSHGLLVDGANEPQFIHIDPHWGSGTRYETLRQFWRNYPESFFGENPRAWECELVAPPNRVRLFARDHSSFSRYLKIGECHIYINAIFGNNNYELLEMTDLVVEMLEDALAVNVDTLTTHEFFSNISELHILIFTVSEIESSDQLKHLTHLVVDKEVWSIDRGYPRAGIPGIRLVVNEVIYKEEMTKVKDRTFQHKLLLDVLYNLNKFINDSRNYNKIKEAIVRKNNLKPRFKMGQVGIGYLFPEHISDNMASSKHVKQARKTAALLSKRLGVKPGDYEQDEAKIILNKIISGMVEIVDELIILLTYEHAIYYAIESIDALAHNHEREIIKINQSLEMEVEYDQKERYYQIKRKYSRNHRNYRYIIEKIVQHEPKGGSDLTSDQLGYIVALVDWLHVYQQASDSIHYDLFVARLSIDTDYKPLVFYGNNHEIHEEQYGYSEAEKELDLENKYADELLSPEEMENHLKNIDMAYIDDYGFSFTSQIELMSLLANWPTYDQDTDLSTVYSATTKEISSIAISVLNDVKEEEVEIILQFLILDPEDTLKIIDPDGSEELCKTLPIWEHKKRPYRYHLRPLIKMGGKHVWGPVSVTRSAIVWAGHIQACSLPIDPNAPSVRRVIEQGKTSMEKSLVSKAFKIVKRYTDYAEKELTHKRGGFPKELGDYDILALLTEKNILISIECKDLQLPFCAKDSLTVRETIFGKKGKEGHFRMINKRNKYLNENMINICKNLEWPISTEAPPTIIDIYLTRIAYWWTKYPKIETKTRLLALNELDEFINQLQNE